MARRTAVVWAAADTAAALHAQYRAEPVPEVRVRLHVLWGGADGGRRAGLDRGAVGRGLHDRRHLHPTGAPAAQGAAAPAYESRPPGPGNGEKGGLGARLKAVGLKAGQGIVWSAEMRVGLRGQVCKVWAPRGGGVPGSTERLAGHVCGGRPRSDDGAVVVVVAGEHEGRGEGPHWRGLGGGAGHRRLGLDPDSPEGPAQRHSSFTSIANWYETWLPIGSVKHPVARGPGAPRVNGWTCTAPERFRPRLDGWFTVLAQRGVRGLTTNDDLVTGPGGGGPGPATVCRTHARTVGWHIRGLDEETALTHLDRVLLPILRRLAGCACSRRCGNCCGTSWNAGTSWCVAKATLRCPLVGGGRFKPRARLTRGLKTRNRYPQLRTPDGPRHGLK